MLRAFTVGFLESFKSCLTLLATLPGLIDALAQLLRWRSLVWLSMTWRWRYLIQSHFFSTTSLTWSLAVHLLFCSVRISLYGWRKQTHTNTHTHTHTHTHTQRERGREREKETERESSVVSDLITMGYELTDKIRSSLLLTWESFFINKQNRNFLSEPFFHVNCHNLVDKNELPKIN